MKTDLAHLPADRLAQIRQLVELIRRAADVEMIILFGPHASGGDCGRVHRLDDGSQQLYCDLDFLVLVADKRIEKHLEQDADLRTEFLRVSESTPVNCIVHTLGHANQMLAQRRYFFMDVVHGGILLYDSGRYDLNEPPDALSADERLRQAQEYFDEWDQKASDHYRAYAMLFDVEMYKLAVFHLHQCAESLYTALRLVNTGYKPRGHDIERMREQAVRLDGAYGDVFRRINRDHRRAYDLLCRAYVDARYQRSYRVSDMELLWLANGVRELQRATSRVCNRLIDEMREQEA